MEEKTGFFRKIFGFIWKHKIVSLIVVGLIVGGVYYWNSKNSTSDETATTYKTQTVEKGDIAVSVTGSGQVNPKSQVDLKPVVAGDAIEVMAVYVKNDQEVKKDQIIALLDSEDAEKSIRDAEINLRSAQIQMKQTENQYTTETIEDKWVRQLQEISLQQRANSLADAKEKLQDYYIKAPFDGVVTDLSVEAGDSISQSDVLASVITQEMVANITLNEVDAAMVKEGNDVELTFDALSDVTMQGKVSKVETIGTVESGVVSYQVEIAFESTSEYLKPGMSVDAEIMIQHKEDVVVVPSSAIKTVNGENYILVQDTSGSVQGGSSTQTTMDQFQMQRKKVELGISNDTSVEIVSGLNEGDVIVVSSTGTGSGTGSGSGSQKNSSSSSSSSILPTMGSGPGGGGGLH